MLIFKANNTKILNETKPTYINFTNKIENPSKVAINEQDKPQQNDLRYGTRC